MKQTITITKTTINWGAIRGWLLCLGCEALGIIVWYNIALQLNGKTSADPIALLLLGFVIILLCLLIMIMALLVLYPFAHFYDTQTYKVTATKIKEDE